jgi:hypothetical protein
MQILDQGEGLSHGLIHLPVACNNYFSLFIHIFQAAGLQKPFSSTSRVRLLSFGKFWVWVI